jgi:hypothetical protein
MIILNPVWFENGSTTLPIKQIIRSIHKNKWIFPYWDNPKEAIPQTKQVVTTLEASDIFK